MSSEALSDLSGVASNMKTVRQNGRYMVATGSQVTNSERLLNEAACLQLLASRGVPTPRLYKTNSQGDGLPMVAGEPAIITDWIEGPNADIWKSPGQITEAVRVFFEQTAQQHHAERGQALVNSLEAIRTFMQSNCIVDLQVVISSATGIATVIDPAAVYEGLQNIPPIHEQTHALVLQVLGQAIVLARKLRDGKKEGIMALDQTGLVAIWEHFERRDFATADLEFAREVVRLLEEAGELSKPTLKERLETSGCLEDEDIQVFVNKYT